MTHRYWACPACGSVVQASGEYSTGTPNLNCTCRFPEAVHVMTELVPAKQGLDVQEHVDRLTEYDDENAACNAMYCAHANEMPVKCPCVGRCFCKRAGGPCDETW